MKSKKQNIPVLTLQSNYMEVSWQITRVITWLCKTCTCKNTPSLFDGNYVRNYLQNVGLQIYVLTR